MKKLLFILLLFPLLGHSQITYQTNYKNQHFAKKLPCTGVGCNGGLIKIDSAIVLGGDSLAIIGLPGSGDAIGISSTGKLFRTSGGGGSGSPAAPLYGIQYNDGGVFAADSGFMFDPTTSEFKSLFGLKGFTNSYIGGQRFFGMIDYDGLVGADSIVAAVLIKRYENPGDDPDNVLIQIGNINEDKFSNFVMEPDLIKITTGGDTEFGSESQDFSAKITTDINSVQLFSKGFADSARGSSGIIDTNRVSFSLNNGRGNFGLTKGNVSVGVAPGFGASYYSTDLKHQHGFTAYGGNADHFSFDVPSGIDVSAFYTSISQTTNFHYYDTTGYHLDPTQKLGNFQVMDNNMTFYTNCKGFGDFAPQNKVMEMDTAKKTVFYGDVEVNANASVNGTMFMENSAEPATPTGGGVLYVEGGALKYKGSSGTVTTIAVP